MRKKMQTTIYLMDDIDKFCKMNKINLSEWVNTEFNKKFLSLESKKKELDILKKQISEIEERLDVVKKSLTAREIRYICQVTPRLREGKNMLAMLNFFNAEHGRNLEISEFKELIVFYERQAVERVKRAIKERYNEKK